MSVLIILVDLQLKIFGLHTAFGVHCFRLRILLCKQRVNPQFTKLKVCFHTEQSRPAIDQRVACRHRYVTGFQ